MWEWDRTRDFFPAQLLATFLTSKGAKGTRGDGIDADDFLNRFYPKRKARQIDPDFGAAGGAFIRSRLRNIGR